MTITEIRDELGLNDSQQHVSNLDDLDSDEALVAGMNTEAAKMEFAVAPGQG